MAGSRPRRPTSFHPGALRDLTDAANYYEGERVGLGSAFLTEVQRVLDRALTHPEAGSPLPNGRRRMLLDRFPYTVLYRVLRGGTVRIVAVVHVRRRPGYGRTRR